MSSSHFPDARVHHPNPPQSPYLTFGSSTGFPRQSIPIYNNQESRCCYPAVPSSNIPNTSPLQQPAGQFYNIKPPLPGYIQEYVNELKSVNAAQAEIITQLKIKLAVKDNDLQHAGKDKESVTNSLGIVIEALTRSGSSSHAVHLPPGVSAVVGQEHGIRTEQSAARGIHAQNASASEKAIQELEQEIEILRKANKRLTRQTQLQTPCPRGRNRARSTDLQHLYPHPRNRTDFPSLEEERRLFNNAERMTYRRECYHKLSDDNVKLHGYARESKDFIPNFQGLGDDSGKPGEELNNHPHQAKDSFDSNTTTIPNTPILAAQKGLVSTCVEDVGIHSLDDILGDEDVDDDQAAQQQQDAMMRFKDMPAPGVVKTGIETVGSFRGSVYDHTLLVARGNGMGMANGRLGREYSNPQLPLSFPTSSSSFEERKYLLENSKTLWTSAEERDDAIRLNKINNGQTGKIFVDFFRYGITFQPTETDSNYQRTVQIGNLPRDVQLRDVLARVRGGEIVSAVLCDTWKLTGGMSVFVHFLHERPAEEYVEFVTQNPITFFCYTDKELEDTESLSKNSQMTATVALIGTPTWPLSIPSRRRIHERFQTRCLLIPNFPSQLSLEHLLRDLACDNGHRAASLTNVKLDDENTLNLEFSSIDAAGSAFGILNSRGMYSECQVRFADDPCKRPLEDLLAPQGPREKNKLQDLGGVGDSELKIQCRLCGEEFENKNRLYAHLRGEHRFSGYKGFENLFSLSSDGFEDRERRGGDASRCPRKQLAALTNQKVEIPSFSGAKITSSSWADEVIEEASPPSEDTPSPINPKPTTSNNSKSSDTQNNIQEQISTLLLEDINEHMHNHNSKIWKDRKTPVGLIGSKYATLVPGFENKTKKNFTRLRGTPRNSISEREERVQEQNGFASRGDNKEGLKEGEESAEDVEVMEFLKLVDRATFEVSGYEKASDVTAPKTRSETLSPKDEILSTSTPSSTSSPPSNSPENKTQTTVPQTPIRTRTIRQLFLIQNPEIEKYLSPLLITKKGFSDSGDYFNPASRDIHCVMSLENIKMEEGKVKNPDEIPLCLNFEV